MQNQGQNGTQWYAIWTFQEHIPAFTVKGDGAPAFPGSLPKEPTPSSAASPRQQVQGLDAAVGQVLAAFRDHGANENDIAVIRPKVLEALERGAYRAALPVRGKYVLAEKVQ